MTALRDVAIKNEYQSYEDDIINEFYIPTLKCAVLYQRAVGYFSSNALIMFSEGIEGLVNNNGKIQLITSPKLSQKDITEITKGYEERKVIENALLRELRDPETVYEAKKLSYIAQLIASGVLDIKIAFVKSSNPIAIFHEKIGIISDKQGDAIAFSGSMNESENGLKSNFECFDVYKSWTNDFERVINKKISFELLWMDCTEGVSTIEFPKVARNKLLDYRDSAKYIKKIEDSPKQLKSENISFEEKTIKLPEDFKIRPYQQDAITAWQNNNYQGIYDMATGTGKTYTALASLETLFREKQRLAIIIVCPYQHLVEQWVEDIRYFNMDPIIGYSASEQKNWKRNFSQAVRSFNLKLTNHFCLVTTNASFVTKTIQNQIQQLNEDTVIVIDEVHNFGAKNYRKYLPEHISYRLGLSATVERKNDSSGTRAITDYFKSKCIIYTLEDAINNNMLCRYKYYPIPVYLDEDELDIYLDLTAQIAKAIAKCKNKKKLSDKAKFLLIKRARIIAGARNKVEALKEAIEPYKNDNFILVYCGATNVYGEDDYEMEFGQKQIDLVGKMLGNDLDMKVGRFTSLESSEERKNIKNSFSDGESLQALVAIKCLDEGVNIPGIKTAFLLASSTNPKEYIQRRGRVLRKAPNKNIVEIYDFITLPFNTDEIHYDQSLFLSSRGLVKREMIRIKEFSSLSENPSESYELFIQLKNKFSITNKDLEQEELDYEI